MNNELEIKISSTNLIDLTQLDKLLKLKNMMGIMKMKDYSLKDCLKIKILLKRKI